MSCVMLKGTCTQSMQLEVCQRQVRCMRPREMSGRVKRQDRDSERRRGHVSYFMWNLDFFFKRQVGRRGKKNLGIGRGPGEEDKRRWWGAYGQRARCVCAAKCLTGNPLLCTINIHQTKRLLGKWGDRSKFPLHSAPLSTLWNMQCEHIQYLKSQCNISI